MNTPRAPFEGPRRFPPRPSFRPPQPMPAGYGLPHSFDHQNFSASPMTFQPQMVPVNPQFSRPGMNNNPNGSFSNNDQLIINLINILAQQRQGQGMPNNGFNNLGLSNHVGLLTNGFPRIATNDLIPTNHGFPHQGQFNVSNYVQPQMNQNFPLPSMFNDAQTISGGMAPNILDPSRAGIPGMPFNSIQSLSPPMLNVLQNLLFSGGNQVNQNHQVSGMVVAGNNVPPAFVPQLRPNTPYPVYPQQPLQNNHGENGHCSAKTDGNSFSSNNKASGWKKEEQRWGHQKNHPHHRDNRKRKFGFDSCRNKGSDHKTFYNREKQDGNPRRFRFDNRNNQEKESKRKVFVPAYTEMEIIKWREDRRKNYPSKANIQNKSKSLVHSDALENEAQQRREQLKEILSKQAELGVEVADIPSHYLRDSDVKRNELNRRTPHRGRNGKFQSYRDKRGNWKNRQGKRIDGIKKQQTLLQKLLSGDIKREKQQLLQAFRFMVSNSFFKNYPEIPLQFPEVRVEDSGCENPKENLPALASENIEKGKYVDSFTKVVSEADNRIEDAEEGEIID